MDSSNLALVMVSKEEWMSVVNSQREILELLKKFTSRNNSLTLVKHITAKEFMDAVRIRRTKFDQLVMSNKIKVIKKKRKIYVPVSEIERYFADPGID